MTVPVASPIDRVTVLVDASRADFFHPPLETYHPVHYIIPRITENLANLLGRRGVVICAGDASADLLDLARHVASELRGSPRQSLSPHLFQSCGRISVLQKK